MNGDKQHKGKRLIGNRNVRARSERSAAAVGRVRIDRTDSGLDRRRLSIQWILSTKEERDNCSCYDDSRLVGMTAEGKTVLRKRMAHGGPHV